MAPHIRSVLFADLDFNWSRPLRVMLEGRGFRVLTAGSVDETLEIAGRDEPDLVAMDAAMSGTPDLAVLTALRARSPGSKLLLMAEAGTPSLEESCRRYGLAWTAVKTLHPAALLDLFLFALMPTSVRHSLVKRRRPLVMCVDDDPRQLNALARTLMAHGCRVCSCETAEQALRLIPDVKPDIALLDIMMPGMDGLDLAQEIKTRFGEPFPVILLTALSFDEAQWEGHQRGAKYFLSKPCDPQQVNDVVDYFAGDIDERRRQEIKARL